MKLWIRIIISFISVVLLLQAAVRIDGNPFAVYLDLPYFIFVLAAAALMTVLSSRKGGIPLFLKSMKKRELDSRELCSLSCLFRTFGVSALLAGLLLSFLGMIGILSNYDDLASVAGPEFAMASLGVLYGLLLALVSVPFSIALKNRADTLYRET